jgi:hypothetical protein
MIDEESKRRSKCAPANSVPVKLADGQEWLIPKPWLQIHASFRGGKPAGHRPALTIGPELDALVEAMAGPLDSTALLSGAATLGAHLVTLSYELDDGDLDKLFAFRRGDPSSWDWAHHVMDAATGLRGARSFRDCDRRAWADSGKSFVR